jgi:hypothetical protein
MKKFSGSYWVSPENMMTPARILRFDCLMAVESFLPNPI